MWVCIILRMRNFCMYMNQWNLSYYWQHHGCQSQQTRKMSLLVLSDLSKVCLLSLHCIMYTKTCLKRPLKIDKTKIFKTNGSLMKVKSIAECSMGSILQYFWPSLSYHLSLRSVFCQFLSGHFTQDLHISISLNTSTLLFISPYMAMSWHLSVFAIVCAYCQGSISLMSVGQLWSNFM